jgi:hypothetical protein
MELIRISFGKDRYHEYLDMIAWCEKHCGEGGYYEFSKNPDTANWSINSMFGNTHFFFRNTEDALLFALRWK